MASEKTWRVGFPIYQGSTLLDFAGATQVFAFTPGFEPLWLAPTLDPVETTERVRVLPVVNQLSGPTQSMSTQLSVQYAPSPPFRSGDPGEAPPEVTADLRAQDQEFIDKIRAATIEVIGGGCHDSYRPSAYPASPAPR